MRRWARTGRLLLRGGRLILRLARLGQRAVLGLWGFERRWVVTPQGRMHALVRERPGPAPTWIFVHGLAAQAVDWWALLLIMRGRLGRIIVLDLPGHGASPQPLGAARAAALIEGAHAAVDGLLRPDERYVLVGSSLGGAIAVRLACRQPQRAVALALISPAGAPMSPAEVERTLGLFDVTCFADAQRFARHVLPDPWPGRWLFALAVWAHLSRPSLRRLVPALRTAARLTPADLASLPPTLLVWGEKDGMLPTSSRDWFVAGLAGTVHRVVRPAAFAHTPFLDHPFALAALLADWPPGGR